MVVFQQIYNRNNNKGEFPIRSLADEKYVKASSTLPRKDKINEVEVEAQNREKSVSSWRAFKGGLGQMMVIFEKPYLKNCVIAFTIQFGFLWSQNTMRLWLPSILAMITEFEDTNDVSAFELCQVIESATTALSSWNDTGSDNIVTVACSQVGIFFRIITVNYNWLDNDDDTTPYLIISLFCLPTNRWWMIVFIRTRLRWALWASWGSHSPEAL